MKKLIKLFDIIDISHSARNIIISTLIIAIFLSIYSVMFYGIYTIAGEHTVTFRSMSADNIFHDFNFYNFRDSNRNLLTQPSLEEGEMSYAQSQYFNVDLTIDDVRKQRLLLLDGINDNIKRLSEGAFKQTALSGELRSRLTNEIDDIANLLQTDKLDEAIAKLADLKSNIISLLNPESQRELILLIDNLVGTLKKQI